MAKGDSRERCVWERVQVHNVCVVELIGDNFDKAGHKPCWSRPERISNWFFFSWTARCWRRDLVSYLVLLLLAASCGRWLGLGPGYLTDSAESVFFRLFPLLRAARESNMENRLPRKKTSYSSNLLRSPIPSLPLLLRLATSHQSSHGYELCLHIKKEYHFKIGSIASCSHPFPISTPLLSTQTHTSIPHMFSFAWATLCSISRSRPTRSFWPGTFFHFISFYFISLQLHNNARSQEQALHSTLNHIFPFLFSPTPSCFS